jgi:hypothetical protein
MSSPFPSLPFFSSLLFSFSPPIGLSFSFPLSLDLPFNPFLM